MVEKMEIYQCLNRENLYMIVTRCSEQREKVLLIDGSGQMRRDGRSSDTILKTWIKEFRQYNQQKEGGFPLSSLSFSLYVYTHNIW